MLRTTMLSACLTLAGYASAAWLTHDFQVWTAEGARRIEVALKPINLPAIGTDGPNTARQPLHQLLADGESITLVDFFYTRCQTVCRALGSSFQQMQAILQATAKKDVPAGQVKLLSISFDGQYDTPEILQTYATRLNADPRLWRFVRVPDIKENQDLLNKLQVIVVPDGRGDFEHNAALLIVDRKGRLVRIFDYADQQLALDYARDLASRKSP
ncbi:MAG: SCO family protein [Pseudomonadota bacterium]